MYSFQEKKIGRRYVRSLTRTSKEQRKIKSKPRGYRFFDLFILYKILLQKTI